MIVVIPICLGMGTVAALLNIWTWIGGEEIVVINIFVVLKINALRFEVFDVRSSFADADACIATEITLVF